MKERLDVLLVEQGFYETREKAKRACMAGLVFVNGQISDKPGMSVRDDSVITIKGNVCPYVGRGGLKLEKALRTFQISVDGLVCADIGASTGGFTDCMLQNGATKVLAIDVGHGQLDYKLRNDPRVVNLEKTNIREYDPDSHDHVGFLSIDVSFISTNLVFPVAVRMLDLENSPLPQMVSLVKPQFEAGREQVGKHGIVTDPKIHSEVIAKVCQYGLDAGLTPINLTFSPMTGAKGNIEFLLHWIPTAFYAKQPELYHPVTGDQIAGVVSQAHTTLKG